MIADRPRMQALTTLFGNRRRPRGFLRRVDWFVGQLCSFELMFVLFLYSNELKTIINFPFPVDETVVFGTAALGMGMYIAFREGIYTRGLPVVYTALIFILWCVVSAGWSPSHTLVKKSIAYLLTFTVFSVVSGALIIANKRERAVRLFWCVMGVAMFMAIYGLVIYVKYGDFQRWAGWQDTEGRAYLAFGHTVVNGCGVAFTIAIFSRLGSMRQAVGMAMFIACSFFLLVGGGRGPFLGAAIAALVGLATKPPQISRGKFEIPYATVVAVMLFALAATYVAAILMSGNLTTTLSRFAKLMDQANDTGSAIKGPNRWEYWGAAYHFWLSAPIIGHGLSSFSYLFRHGVEVEGTHPHDIFLEMLAEMGTVGFVLFFVFFGTAFREATFARLKRDRLLTCVVLFVITSSMSALFGRDIVGVRKFFFAISLMALRPPSNGVELAEEEEEEHGRVAGRLQPRARSQAPVPAMSTAAGGTDMR